MNKPISVVAAVLYREGKVFLFRRGPGAGVGAWEFPGGKVDPGESAEEALRREIQEELNIQITLEEKLGETLHQYPSKLIHLSFYWAPWPEGAVLKLSEHDAFLEVRPSEIKIETLSEADREIVSVIAASARMKV